MRHYYGYKSDGTIGSIEVYGGGWPVCMCREGCKCLADPSCKMPACVSLRARRAKVNPDIIGFVLYDCPCKKEDHKHCIGCLNEFPANSYVDVQTGEAITKPLMTVQLDGQVVEHNSVNSAPPGSKKFLTIVCPEVPDGAIVNFSVGSGGADITAGPNEFTETVVGGTIPSVELVAPGQGAKGAIVVYGKYIRPRQIILRGWAD